MKHVQYILILKTGKRFLNLTGSHRSWDVCRCSLEALAWRYGSDFDGPGCRWLLSSRADSDWNHPLHVLNWWQPKRPRQNKATKWCKELWNSFCCWQCWRCWLCCWCCCCWRYWRCWRCWLSWCCWCWRCWWFSCWRCRCRWCCCSWMQFMFVLLMLLLMLTLSLLIQFMLLLLML